MKNNTQTRVTQKFSLDSSLTDDMCANPNCRMTILVDKEDKLMGRKSHCTACLIKQKIRSGEIK